MAALQHPFSTVMSSAIVHYPQTPSPTNNLTFALYGTGAPGIYNSSATPSRIYGTYNWCNMPHTRVQEYRKPSSDYNLLYVEVIQRHHKRTPYASNVFPMESDEWSCVGEGVRYGLTGNKRAYSVEWQVYRDTTNPWSTLAASGFSNSSCQFPQITREGLEDSIQHGTDLRLVYFNRLNVARPDKTTAIRVTNNVITSQVASGLFAGLFPGVDAASLVTIVQPSSIDSLEPTYPCPRANTIRSGYTTGSNGKSWQDHLTLAQDFYAQLDKVSGIPNPDNGGWHASFDHYYDNLSAKRCHGKRLPCKDGSPSSCISQEQANTVYRLGHWEYSYQFRDASESAQYAALRFGVWMLELKAHLVSKAQGVSKMKYVHNVAHDGSISTLLGFLQIDHMVWPGMGSEIVFELYSKRGQHFVRVLWSGQPLRTSTPLGVLDMIPLGDFVQYIDTMVQNGQALYAACTQ